MMITHRMKVLGRPVVRAMNVANFVKAFDMARGSRRSDRRSWSRKEKPRDVTLSA